MKLSHLATLSLVLAGTAVQAQTPTITGLVQVWYHQVLDNNLRLNDAAKYTNAIRSEYKENGFTVRRAELKFAGKITEEVSYEVMVDPTIAASATNNLLQDVALIWKPVKNLEFRVGQFKNQQTLEGVTSSSELQFIDRGMLANAFGDVRDRGALASYLFGDTKGFAGKITVGVLNGQGKLADSNAQKDFVGRVEFTYAKSQKFGAYTLMGSTDQADKGALAAKTFAGINAPTATAILDNKDQTSQLGAFYQYQDGAWYGAAELIAGVLGRRAAGVGTTGAAGREHLDQKFGGLTLTGAYSFKNHTFHLRYDNLNYNTGDEWYGTTNPYKTAAADYTPNFTLLTLGYTYAFNPAKVKAANFKLNYIARSKNVLKARTGQTGEQGGDSLLAQFQVSF